MLKAELGVGCITLELQPKKPNNWTRARAGSGQPNWVAPSWKWSAKLGSLLWPVLYYTGSPNMLGAGWAFRSTNN